jgi:hypothetical protein
MPAPLNHADTNISTLCPTYRALCTWYRNRDMLYGFCKEHGVVDKLPLIRGA